MNATSTSELNELLILLSFIHPTEDERTQINQLANNIADPNQLYALAKKNVVVPWIYHQIQKFTPAHFQQKLNLGTWAIEANEIKQINTLRLQRALPVLRDMKQAGIPVIMLKGIMLAELLYHNSFYKRMNDVDILIAPKDLPQIYQIYKRHGFFYVGERVGKDLAKQLKVSHHAPPFIHPQLDCMFGTQWGLKSPFAKLNIDYPTLWKRAVPCAFHGLDLLALSAEDNLFHLCIHLGHFKSGLRDLMDLVNLLRQHYATFDWAYFTQSIEKSGAQSLCYHALTLLQAYYPTPKVAEVLARLRPHTTAYFRALAQRKTKSQDILLNHSSSYLAEIEKGISEFNLSDNFQQKAKLFFQVWGDLLWPPQNEAIALSCLYRPNQLTIAHARMLAPYRLLRAIGHEIGHWLLLGLFIKTKLDLLVSLKQQLFHWRAGLTLEEKIGTHGINAEQITRFKNLVQ